METCSDCIFYQSNMKDISKGECHFKPPQVFPFMLQGNMGIRCQWPHVKMDSVACSEMVEKPKHANN